jgi:hypothetical protein
MLTLSTGLARLPRELHSFAVRGGNVVHAVVVHSTLHDFDAALTFARDQVVPRVSAAPGLVAGYWVRVAEDKGVSVVVFESEDAARTMAEQVSPPPDGSVTANTVEVGEVVAHT